MPTALSQEKREWWREKLQQQKASGLSIKRWCEENQVSGPKFFYWKERLFPNAIERSLFTEVKEKKSGVSLEWRGVSVQLGADFDPSTLKRFLATLVEMT